ncbi:TolC family outer membrane protein [uncultured Tateyamaria sp.]|uniref:TolC family outer membrane protein n=1 Tax=uncultured Tateyamaria sp. TaxID=455651 RepID=UPI002625D4D0|nr:TolC family outer membrane protein [uncultured Tateyamaria sp.]
MGRRLLRSTAVSAVLALGLSTAQATADTLADALVGAYNHSGLLDQNRALLRAADEDVPIALAQLRPIINWTANITQTFGDSRSQLGVSSSVESTDVSLGLTASLQIYDGGADAARVEATKEIVLATRATLLDVEQTLLLNAVTAFVNVGQQGNLLALSQNNLRLLQEELRAANDRFEVGEITRTDVSLAEAAVANARSNVADAQRDLIQAQAFYTNVVGRPPGRLSPLPALPQTEKRIPEAQAVAVRNHPDMENARRQVSSNELLVTAAVRDTLPVVTLDGSLGLQEDIGDVDSSSTGSVGINLVGPIYQGGALSALERRAMAVRDASRGNLHNIRHIVQQDVVNAISDLEAAQASLAASERQIRAARIAFQGVREEATLGARTTLDVLDAEQDLLDAETNRISARAAQYIAAYSVLESMGLLTAQRLKLPVQLYDPAAYYNLVKNGPAKRSRQGKQLDRVLRALQVDD